MNLVAADVNGDGKISLADATLVLKHIAGWINIELKPGKELTCSVSFYDGDRLIDTLIADKDQPLGAVPDVTKSSKANAILVGYFTDPECTQPFYAENPVTEDMNVYAKYEEMGTTEELNFTSFAQMDQTADMTFEVIGDGDPAKAITLEVMDGTDPVELKFEAADGGYIVGAVDGFNEGASYQLHLGDGWTFKDKPETIRTASFSIAKEQVENIRMNDEIVYIKDTDAIDYTVDGQTYDMLTSELADKGGTFTYSASGIAVGDLICIYLGVHPEERDMNADVLDPAIYVKVTAISGSTITFGQLGEDDYLKLYNLPDNFPILVDALPAGETGTINISRLDAEIYTSMMGEGYDLAKAKSVIGVGDFISLYTDWDAIDAEDDICFGEITAYNAQTGEVTYKKTTKQAITECMDLYTDVEISGDDLISEEEQEEIEVLILEQIRDSGFAEDAAFALADMITKTDGFKNASIDSLLITDSKGNEISPDELQLMNLGGSFELTDDIKLTVELITKGDQLRYKNGTRIAVGVEAEFEIELEDDEKIKIDLNASFAQEVMISPKVKGFVILYFFGFIPVPVGANVSGTIDIKSYTAFSFAAEIYTVAPEEESLWDQFKDVMENPEKLADIAGLPEELSEGLKTAGDVLDKIEEMKDELAKIKDTAEGTLETIEAYQKDIQILWETIDHVITEEDYSAICEGLDRTSITSELLDMMNLTTETGLETEYYDSLEALMERYCEMIEKETDWVTLVEKDIFERDVCVYGIAIGVDVDFVVRADLCLAIGSNLEYEVGKRYEFWCKMAPGYKKAGNKTMDLLDERFAFQFYVMGRLGLKAGIRAKLEFGIGSCAIANVGVYIELGPYMKLWGFFVYEYEKYRVSNTSQWNSDERMAGALLMEFGLYLKMAFEAEALKLFEYEYEFLDKEYPLLTVGKKHFYYEPAYEPEEDESVRVEDKDGNSNNGISMILPDYTVALKYLDMKHGQLAIESPDYSNFIYTVSNPNFSIDSKTGEISVNVPDGIRYMECDLTITYKYGKMAFSTYDMTVTVPLVWTNMTDAELNEYYTASVRVGNDTDGYTTVWQTRVLKNSEFDLPTTDEIKKIIGWNDYKYDMGTGYGSQQTTGLTLIEDKVYDFDIAYDTYSIRVSGIEKEDGTTEGRTYYAKFGETFDFSDLASTGTNSNGEFTKFRDLTIHANINLEKAVDTRMALTLAKGVTAVANYMDNSVTATFSFSGIDADDVTIKLRRGDTPDISAIEAIVAAHGMAIKDISPAITPITSSTMYQVICGELDTAPATITFRENGGSTVSDITKPYGSLIGTLPTPKKTGCTFGGWYTDSALTKLFTETKMPEGGITLYAKWTANQYTVTFNVNGGNEMASNKLTVTYGKDYGPLLRAERTGYGFIGWFTAPQGGTQVTSATTYSIEGNQTLYAQWRELIDLSVDYFIDVNASTFTYRQGNSYNIERLSRASVLPEGLTPDDFTYEFICEGYEDEGYFTDVTKAGTWGVRISRPADDTYAKFEDFQSGVLTIEQATRDLTGTKVSQVGNSLTYVELKLGSEIFDLDENAQIRYAFGIKILGAFGVYSRSNTVSYKESAFVRDLTPDTGYNLLRIYVTGDRNYKDVSYDITGTTYNTIKPSGDSWANHADTSWYTNHTDYTDYYITSPAQLAGLAKLVNDGTTTFFGKTIHMSTRLNMSAYTWTPIGNSSRYFAGDFYGHNCTISGLYYSNSSGANIGLFGYVGGYVATVRDVVVDDSYFYGDTRVGGIVGCGDSAYIYNCTNYAIIRADQKGSNYESCAGGIVGEIENGWVYNCVNYGSVYSEGRLTGGVVGLIDVGGAVMNCANFGSVTGSSRVGGVVGCMDGKNTQVLNCYNVGAVRPNDESNDYIGAIVGRNVSDNGICMYNYYLKDCAKGGNDKSRYAVGNDGGSVTDGNKSYYASSFENLESLMNSSAGAYAGKTLIEALNEYAGDSSTLYIWTYTGPSGYPLPQLSPVSGIR